MSADDHHRFRLQVISDVHLEQLNRKATNWKEELVQPMCDTVACLGDLCELQHGELWQEFVGYLAAHWRLVLLVNGNHEYHNDERLTVDELKARQREWLQQWPHVHWLDDSEWVVRRPDDGQPVVVVWGATFWSRVPAKHAAETERQLRDYHLTWVPYPFELPVETTTTQDEPAEVVKLERRLRVADTNQWHEAAVTRLAEYLHTDHHHTVPLIVLTHHAPLTQGTSSPRFELDRERALNSAFASHQAGLFHPRVKLWAFGHTHWHADFMYRTTRVVSNPHGYGHSDACTAAYRSNWVLEVDTTTGAPHTS